MERHPEVGEEIAKAKQPMNSTKAFTSDQRQTSTEL